MKTFYFYTGVRVHEHTPPARVTPGNVVSVENMKTPHKHAALIKQFAEDMAIDKELISKWKYRIPKDVYFTNVNHAPSWIEDYEYRREPETITVNGVEVPEPCREPLERGDVYWEVSLIRCRPFRERWHGIPLEREQLSLGLIHLTKEAAQAHIDALLLPSKKK